MTDSIVTPLAAQLDLLTAAVGVGGFLNGAKLNLSTTVISPDQNTVLADFTPTTFTGGAPVALVWGTPYIDPITGLATVDAASHTFVSTVIPSPETVSSIFLTDGAGAVYEGGAALVNPVPIVNVGDGLTVQVRYTYGG